MGRDWFQCRSFGSRFEFFVAAKEPRRIRSARSGWQPLLFGRFFRLLGLGDGPVGVAYLESGEAAHGDVLA